MPSRRMAPYSLRFNASVRKDLRRIPKEQVEQILRRIEALAVNPRPSGCEKLSRQERYRIRQGMYRILYEVLDAELVVHVVKVGHRRHVYRS